MKRDDCRNLAIGDIVRRIDSLQEYTVISHEDGVVVAQSLKTISEQEWILERKAGKGEASSCACQK